MRLRLGYLAAALMTTVAGAATRFARLGLPPFIVKYGGSALWAAAIFWMISVIWPRWNALRRASLAMVVAWAIEFFKLVKSPWLDHVRGTLLGKLVLGRYFAWADLVAYAVGIAAVALLETTVRRVSKPTPA